MAIEANRKTIRFMLFILAFLAVVMLFVFLVVIPSIKTFKSKKVEYARQIKMQQTLKNKQAQLEKELSKVQKQYRKALDAFQEPFDEKAFLALARKYFQDVRLIPQDQKKTESGLQIYAFKADFDAKTPIQFYRFVDELKQMHNVVKINFPIELDAQNGVIHLQFQMSVYRL